MGDLPVFHLLSLRHRGCEYLFSTERTFEVDGMSHILDILYFEIFEFILDNNSLKLPNVLEVVSGQLIQMSSSVSPQKNSTGLNPYVPTHPVHKGTPFSHSMETLALL